MFIWDCSGPSSGVNGGKDNDEAFSSEAACACLRMRGRMGRHQEQRVDGTEGKSQQGDGTQSSNDESTARLRS